MVDDNIIAKAPPTSTYNRNVDRVISDICQKFQIEPFRFDPLRQIATDVSTPSESSETTTAIDGISISVGKFFNIDVSSPQEKLRFSSIADRVESAINEYATATMLGAALGAAVTTGLGVGLIAACSVLSSPEYLKTLYQWTIFRKSKWFRRKHFDSTQAVVNQTSEENYNVSNVTHQTNVSIIGKGENKIIILQGNTRTSPHIMPSSLAQCRACLDHISALLGKQSSGWKDVRRLTAYLVNDLCDAHTFREALKEYPLQIDRAIVNILFVQRLEDDAMVQVEILASGSEE